MSSSTGQPTKTLRELREARGWTQAVLAGRLRVGTTTVSQWETGARMPSEVDRQRLADLFGVSAGEIVFGWGEKPGMRVLLARAWLW